MRSERPTLRRHRRIRHLGVVVVFVAAVAGCATDDATGGPRDGSTVPSSGDVAGGTLPPALTLLASAPSPHARGDDIWEVWTCHVPTTVGHPVYADDPWRMTLTAEELAALLDEGVGDWFATLSHGAYRPVFRAGGRVRVATDADGDDCAEEAIARAGGGTEGVLVVADARHRRDVSGGWGRPGVCDDPCVASTVDVTGRAVSLGAADFGPEWGTRPPLDLVQHEIGHALDLPHSGDESEGDRYTSPLDLMSDSTAPRQVRPDRRDAPDTIAANRIALGWLRLDDVAVVPADGEEVVLAPSTGPEGTRAAVVVLDAGRLVTVELLMPSGANDHLPGAGIAVHLVDQSPTVCEAPDRPLCTGLYRRQVPLAGDALHPGIPLLGVGDSVDVGPMVVRVLALDGSQGRVAIEPG